MATPTLVDQHDSIVSWIEELRVFGVASCPWTTVHDQRRLSRSIPVLFVVDSVSVAHVKRATFVGLAVRIQLRPSASRTFPSAFLLVGWVPARVPSYASESSHVHGTSTTTSTWVPSTSFPRVCVCVCFLSVFRPCRWDAWERLDRSKPDGRVRLDEIAWTGGVPLSCRASSRQTVGRDIRRSALASWWTTTGRIRTWRRNSRGGILASHVPFFSLDGSLPSEVPFRSGSKGPFDWKLVGLVGNEPKGGT